jgi:hypothetical protein
MCLPVPFCLRPDNDDVYLQPHPGYICTPSRCGDTPIGVALQSNTKSPDRSGESQEFGNGQKEGPDSPRGQGGRSQDQGPGSPQAENKAQPDEIQAFGRRVALYTEAPLSCLIDDHLDVQARRSRALPPGLTAVGAHYSPTLRRAAFAASSSPISISTNERYRALISRPCRSPVASASAIRRSKKHSAWDGAASSSN